MKWYENIDIAEIMALVILGFIAGVAMFTLGIDGKEIPLAIGSAIGGYLTKSAVNGVKSALKGPESQQEA